MSETDFPRKLRLQGISRSIVHVIDALLVLPNYDANKELIESYEARLVKLLADMKSELE